VTLRIVADSGAEDCAAAASARPGSRPENSAAQASDTYTDERARWDWKSKYPDDARKQITGEAWFLTVLLLIALSSAALTLGIAQAGLYIFRIGPLDVHVSFRILAIFSSGCVGGTTFSIKWLIHSAAKGKWHLDRRYWRLLVPAIGGVYACVVMTLSGAGMFSSPSGASLPPLAPTAALAFMVGYFSDGVSGLLSNVANAVFGTLEKK
jgi:hypothetical protein